MYSVHRRIIYFTNSTVFNSLFHVFIFIVFLKTHAVRYSSFLWVIILLTCSFHKSPKSISVLSNVLLYNPFTIIFLYLPSNPWSNPKNQKTRKSLFINELRDNFVVPPGIEPGTQGFSVLCSTN